MSSLAAFQALSTTSPFFPKLSTAISTRNYEQDVGYASDDVNDYVSSLTRNNSFFSATSLAFRKGIIGLGLNIQSNTDDKKFNAEFEKIIRKWGRKTGGIGKGRSHCELSGRFFFQEAQRAMADEYAGKAGGVLVAHHHSSSFKYGYKFEIIPISRIDTGKNDNYKRIINGFQIDKAGEITHIYLFPDEKAYFSEAVPYKNLTLAVNKWADPLQYSAVSPQASIVEALEYIDNYKAKEMDGAGQRADNPIIVKTPYFTDLMRSTAQEKAKAEALTFKGEIPFEIVQYVHGLKRLDNEKKYKGGFSYISDDEDVVELGKAVQTIYPDMWANESRSASAGIGLTASSTVGEMSSSYNEALRGVQSEERLYQIYAQELYESLIREIIEIHLLRGCIMKRILNLPDFYDDPEKYRDTSYLRTETGHIDPSKTAKATTEDVLINRTKTMKRALAEKGIDEDTHFAERESYDEKDFEYNVRMQEKWAAKGLIYPGSIQHETTLKDSDLKDEE